MQINQKHIDAATLIVSGALMKDVAEALGISPQTLSNWRLDDEFKRLIAQLQWGALNGARDQLRTMAPLAVAALNDALQPDSPFSARLKAVEIVLRHTGFADPAGGLYGWGIDSPPRKL